MSDNSGNNQDHISYFTYILYLCAYYGCLVLLAVEDLMAEKWFSTCLIWEEKKQKCAWRKVCEMV